MAATEIDNQEMTALNKSYDNDREHACCHSCKGMDVYKRALSHCQLTMRVNLKMKTAKQNSDILGNAAGRYYLLML